MAREDSGISFKDELKGPAGKLEGSMFVVWFDSRRALIVELALKQFSIRSETPNT